jgi:putative acyl-CoA dehydrogenase
MTTLESGPSAYATHELVNQPPPLVNYNTFLADQVLQQAIRREGASWAEPLLREIGQAAGSEMAINLGFAANTHPPILRTHDPRGNRIDEVELHPAWHQLMERAIGWGLHALPWRDPRSGAHVARLAAFYLWSQVDSGHGCPVSMTHAAIPVLRASPQLATIWEPLLTSSVYDPNLRPAQDKQGALCGMAMTEKQGGSDVRTNTTRAERVDRDQYLVTGHKWFCSAPMSDAFLVLARAPDGLSCFLLPRILPDGTRNSILLLRLKDKLGNRSNASAEIELEGALAHRIGEEGDGIRTIIEMVNFTRLDCIAGTAALMRQAVAQAIHHAVHRSAFGRHLIDQPLMRNVLADLAIESEAATVLFLRLARAYDEAAAGNEREARLKRLGTAIGKYWVCKRGPAVTAEALECLGGNGYVEESIMPRLYREAPLNSIWEGSGNVNCLDVLRVLAGEPETLDAFFGEIEPAAQDDPRLRDALAGLRRDLPRADEVQGRGVVERMALALQAALLVRFSPPAVADAFCASRLSRDGGLAFGTLPSSVDFTAIIHRAGPHP